MKHKVRTLMRGGEPWWVLADICAVLDVINPTRASDRLDAEDCDLPTMKDTLGRDQKLNLINESGLWSLVLTSRKPEAKAFKKWLTSVVIPALRKNGGYVVGQENPL